MSEFTELLEQDSPDKDECDFLESYPYLVGLDETGRGALAGPVFVAGCRIEPSDLESSWIESIDDSKSLTVGSRKQLASMIQEKADDWIVVGCEPWVIDEQGINASIRSCMETIVSEIATPDGLVVVDGQDALLGTEPDTISVVQGDQRFKSIGAASILAKTERDHFMTHLSFDYPYYEFEDNAGYGTGEHRIALDQEGPSEIHRVSFSPISDMSVEFDERSSRHPLASVAVEKHSEPPHYVVKRA